MKKFTLTLLVAALPLCSQAALDPRVDYDYPGFAQDKRQLDNNYNELRKDQRRGSRKAIKNDKQRINSLEAEINQKQDDFEDYLRDHWRGKRRDDWKPHNDNHHDDHDEHDQHDLPWRR